MPKITKEQAESFREIARSAISSFIELGATKDEEVKLKKQVKMLFDSGMTERDLDYVFQLLARDKDAAEMKPLQYARKVLKS
jgi:hypothetical protein